MGAEINLRLFERTCSSSRKQTITQ